MRLERLLRYCARPCSASEPLTEAGDGERLICTLPKPVLTTAGKSPIEPRTSVSAEQCRQVGVAQLAGFIAG